MPKNITQYNLLISCPGDITNEIKIIEEVVEKLIILCTFNAILFDCEKNRHD